MGETVKLKAADGHDFDTYVAMPSGDPKGAIVVAMEIFGINSHIRAVADGYAAEGYVAVAPAFLDRVKPGVELGYTDDDIAEARELIGQLLCADKVTRLTASEALEHRWITGGSVGANGEDGAKPINRSRMERFAETHMDAGALETRELRPGDLLIKQGARAKEIFLIREGSCEVVVKKDDGSELKVAERHAG